MFRRNFRKAVDHVGFISRSEASVKYKISYSSLRRYELSEYYIKSLDCFTPRLEKFKFEGSREAWYEERQVKELVKLRNLLNL